LESDAFPGFDEDSVDEDDGVEDDGVEDDGVEDDDDDDRPCPPYPSLYQPPPRSWNADREISFSSAPEHSVHFFNGLSLNFWITSNVRPQDVQRYS
jgi:hypothetical protein